MIPKKAIFVILIIGLAHCAYSQHKLWGFKYIWNTDTTVWFGEIDTSTCSFNIIQALPSIVKDAGGAKRYFKDGEFIIADQTISGNIKAGNIWHYNSTTNTVNLLTQQPAWHGLALTKDSLVYTYGYLDTFLIEGSLRAKKFQNKWLPPPMLPNNSILGYIYDLFILNKELYGTIWKSSTINRYLVKIKLDTKSDYEILMDTMQLKNANKFANAAPSCDTTILYGISGHIGKGNKEGLYLVNPFKKETRLVCESSDLDNIRSIVSTYDNRVIDCRLSIDLDDDNSSGKLKNDFQAKTICNPNEPIPIADVDSWVNSEQRIDSIVITLEKGVKNPNAEHLFTTNISIPNILISGNYSNRIILKNTGFAKCWHFNAALLSIRYEYNGTSNFTQGERIISVIAYGDNATSDTAKAFIWLETTNAGQDTVITLCGMKSINLLDYVVGASHKYGYFIPQLKSGTDYFDPEKDKNNIYKYVLSSAFCNRHDTSYLQIETLPKTVVKNIDTILCFGKSITIRNQTYSGSGFFQQKVLFQKNNCDSLVINLNIMVLPKSTTQIDTTIQSGTSLTIGSRIYNSKGDYIIKLENKQGCDSLVILKLDIATYDLSDYLPSIINPSSGDNNGLFGFVPKSPIQKINKMQIFSRWGEKVFEIENVGHDDNTAFWNGTFNGKNLASDVYVYYIQVEMKNGLLQSIKGNVTLVH